MKRIILHIGMHKTGSSSIQRSLNGYDDGRVRYADLGTENHSIPIYSMFSDTRYEKRFFRQRGIGRAEIDRRTEVYASRLTRELEIDRETLILSGEDISRIPADDVPAIRDFLAPRCDEITVVGYLRDPVAFASSQFQQRVKFDARGIKIPEPGYRDRFEKFLEVFGPENVILRDFNRDTLVDGSVVQDLMEIAGIRGADWPEQVTNESLSDAATRLLFRFNRHGPVTTGCRQALEARKAFVHLMGRVFPGASYRLPRALFTRETVDVADLDWLKDAAAIDFTDDFAEGAPDLEAARAEMERPRPEEIERLRHILDARGIKTRSDVTVDAALSFLFYDVMVQGWKSKTAARQARKKARRAAQRKAEAAAAREG
ncbi:hypothetical protein [Jannaschia marina]|uniref:hypothetical protein n=1 Tax=Jannaschia marina TaxID=2741674 RepID=UPI0015CD7BC4|nr:hypothetical protein [Jannaschia marina]